MEIAIGILILIWIRSRIRSRSTGNVRRVKVQGEKAEVRRKQSIHDSSSGGRINLAE